MTAIHAAIRPLAILALCALMVTVGCAKKPKPVITPPTTTGDGTTGGNTNPSGDGNSGSTENQGDNGSKDASKIQDVFFDYDRFALRDDARETLNGNAKVLIDAAGLRYVLEGHCDERGTEEYNLALGEKRANAVKEYLVRYGVDGARLSTVSFGEEQPFDPGHDENAWEANRRVHFARQ
ncbi:MAG: peptidoglycan-associated lipoprotein Pal [Candidatus Eisenbacteria bacterium]